jgi:hypothetical protein
MGLRIHDMSQPGVPSYMPGATVDKVAALNTALLEIQAASHYSNLLFAGPDIGGILLYSNGIRVLDLGALCDPVLARRGYGDAIAYVLERRQPDAIDVHWNWTTQTNFQASPLFIDRYRPVYVRGFRIFLTRKLLEEINPSRLTERHFRADGHPENETPADTVQGKYGPNDYLLNHEFGSYFLLK